MTKEKKAIISALIWLCITLFYCYQYILRVLPNIIMPDIMQQFNIGASEYGSFAGIYYIGYVAVHIPIGILLNRFGGKKILPLCIALTALGLLPLSYSNNWHMVLLGRVITGIGSSAAIVGGLQIFRIIFPQNFTRMLGFMVSVSLITAVYSGKPLSIIISTIGVKATLNILLYLGIILAIITYFLMPKESNQTSDKNIINTIKSILTNYKIIFVSICAGMMVGPVEGFSDAWGSAFLISVYGLDKPLADSIVILIFLGMCAGSILLPYIAEKTEFYIGTTIFAGIVMVNCFALLINKTINTTENLYLVCLLIGVFSSYQVVIISKISTYVSSERSGIAASVANMIIMGFGWVFHNAIGFSLEKLWEGQMIGETRIYSVEAFTQTMIIIPAFTAIAVIGLCVVSIKEYVNKRKLSEK